MSFKGNVSLVLGGLGPSLGRKGTASDLTVYNHKVGDMVLSFVEPTTYPDKIQSLTSAVNMCDQAVLKVNAVDAVFAESVVCLDAMGVEKGYIILGEGVGEKSIRDFTIGSLLEKYSFVSEQVVELRDKLAELEPARAGNVLVQVDHSFTVKGVGTVALGVVKQGVVKKYDKLGIYSAGGETIVKSIQVHDTDVTEAGCGARVGLCLKDVKPEDVTRGAILSTAKVETVKSFDVESTISKYAQQGLKEGDVFLVNASLNYVPAKVVGGEVKPGGSAKIKIELEKEIPIISDRISYLDPSRKKPRVFGYGRVK